MPLELLLNNKEIANFLNSQIDIVSQLKKIEYMDTHLAETIIWIRVGIDKKGQEALDKEQKAKYLEKITKSVKRDLRAYLETVKKQLEYFKENNRDAIHKNIDYILEKLGEDLVLEQYQQSQITGFVKGVGSHLSTDTKLMRRHNFNTFETDCLIRNTVGNEELLVSKIDNRYPFWFIDSGYTNFLEPNKRWHRLVRSHLHYGNYFDAPVDRLDIFPCFPKPWRQSGEVILIIEPGPFAADIFHVDLKTWKYDVEKELRKHTDKKIKFREKAPKKERTNLYQELADDDYYCIININSNAATEAIWQGIPAITLDRHVTNPVTVDKISAINDLYRGKIADWLCMLSYSQFTYDELIDGTAARIQKKYHV